MMGFNNPFLLPSEGGGFLDNGVGVPVLGPGPGAAVPGSGPALRPGLGPGPIFTATTTTTPTITADDCVSSSLVAIPDATCSSSPAAVVLPVLPPQQSELEPQSQSSQRPPLPLHLLQQQQLQQSMMTSSTINMMGMDPNISPAPDVAVPPPMMNGLSPLQQQQELNNWQEPNASCPFPNVNDMATTMTMNHNHGLLLSQRVQSQQRQQARTAALLRQASSSSPLNDSSCNNKGSRPAPEVIFQNRPGWLRQQTHMTSWFGHDCQVIQQNQYISPQYQIQFDTLQKATTFCKILDEIQLTQYQANGCQYIPQPNECLAYYLLNHLKKNLRQIKQMTIEELVKAQQEVYTLQQNNKLFCANKTTQVKRKRNESQPRKPSKTVEKRQQLKQQKQQKLKQEQRLYLHKLNHVRAKQWKATKAKLETASSKEERRKLQKELSDIQKPNWNCQIQTPQQKHYQKVVKPQRQQQRLQRQQQNNTKLYKK